MSQESENRIEPHPAHADTDRLALRPIACNQNAEVLAASELDQLQGDIDKQQRTLYCLQPSNEHDRPLDFACSRRRRPEAL